MRISRLYTEQALSEGAEITLDAEHSHYLLHVLRLRQGDALSVFNGDGGEYAAVLASVGKKQALLRLGAYRLCDLESPLDLTLVQGVAKPEHMDLVIQKAVELGARRIVPVLTRYTQHFPAHRADKRWQHWYGILTAACMQCGRTRVPELVGVTPLAEWLAHPSDAVRAMLSPQAMQSLSSLQVTASLTLLIGPEGGFSEREETDARDAGYVPVGLGPRILRTETAALAALSVAQACWGDF